MSDTHVDEYEDALVRMLELIWGKGFLAPGGAENVRQIVEGLDLAGKTVLDIGSDLGGGNLVPAGELGARVIGLEIEPPLPPRARAHEARVERPQGGSTGSREGRSLPGELAGDDHRAGQGGAAHRSLSSS